MTEASALEAYLCNRPVRSGPPVRSQVPGKRATGQQQSSLLSTLLEQAAVRVERDPVGGQPSGRLHTGSLPEAGKAGIGSEQVRVVLTARRSGPPDLL